MKRNVPLFGFLIGALLPVLGLAIVFLIFKKDLGDVSGFFQSMMHDSKTASLFLTLALLINIVPFIYYTNKRLDLTARGILVATVLYGVLIVLIKYVW